MDRLDELLTPNPKPSTVGTLVYILFGPILWALQFTLIYGGHTLACSQGATPAAGEWLVYAASIVPAVIVLVFLVVQTPFARILGLTRAMEDRRAYDRIAWAVALLSEFAIVWTGATALVVAACTQGR
ncbi:hypothetical protein ABGN05_07945 [Aquibium sp. LZ166]|uniref:Uncharacterized protein n=1 Tax=Aquibium pacificus TaxID=3153579 RepID=A0ABV3SFP7_9HYPH